MSGELTIFQGYLIPLLAPHRLIIFGVAVLLSFQAAILHASQTLSAREIMERVDGRDDGDNMIADMEMVLIDKHGKQRHRCLRSYVKDKGDDSLRLFFFIHPAEVRNTGLLIWDYRKSIRDDDQWLYLPSLQKTKRIATSDKSDSFMGSDFTYADLTRFDPDDYDFELEKESVVGAFKVWVISAVPRTEKVIQETGYQKSLLLVRQDNYCVVRGVHWLVKLNYYKYMDVIKLERLDGIWVNTEVHMATKYGTETNHKSILRQYNVKFDQDLTEEQFTVRQLERGL